MRSSTSPFRPALLWLLGTLALAAVPYAHWIALAPEAQDRLSEVVEAPAAPPPGEEVAVFGAECLVGALVHPADYCQPVTLSPEDDPYAFLPRLTGPQPPRRIVVLEDSTFFLFARPGSTNQVAPSSPAAAANTAVTAAMPADPLSFDDHVTLARHRKDREDQEFRRGLRAASLADPLTLRKLVANSAGWLTQQATPVLTDPTRQAAHLLRGYALLLRSGETKELVAAWKAYRMALPAPALRAALRERLLGAMTVASYSQPYGTPERCLETTYVAGEPPPSPPWERYPLVAALFEAEARGAEIRVALAPYNEHIERQCEAALRPWQEALRQIARERGWPLADLRAVSNPDIAAEGNFVDRYHLIMQDSPRFRRAFAQRFAAAAAISTCRR